MTLRPFTHMTHACVGGYCVLTTYCTRYDMPEAGVIEAANLAVELPIHPAWRIQ